MCSFVALLMMEASTVRRRSTTVALSVALIATAGTVVGCGSAPPSHVSPHTKRHQHHHCHQQPTSRCHVHRHGPGHH